MHIGWKRRAVEEQEAGPGKLATNNSLTASQPSGLTYRAGGKEFHGAGEQVI